MSSLLLIAAGLSGGALNAVAGGGSFLTLPALVFAGLPAVTANASSTVALFPGSFASAFAFRHDFRDFQGLSVRALLPLNIVGGIAGAALLLVTREAVFDRILPWLFLVGTLAFAFGRGAGAFLRRFVRMGRAPLLVAQFALAVYGGYFGGAVGLMMMAFWSLFGVDDLRAMNAAKALLVGSLNCVAVACFAAAGVVAWGPAAVMGAAAMAGGYLGARWGRRANQARLRAAISILNVLLTLALFARGR
ncbi:MAG: sulfite exporter TauE/SafE family protein [Anaeromyxobacteraceae bacterium]